MPKSATVQCAPVRRMFSGLMSRWTTPWLMRVVEGRRHLSGDAERIRHRELALALKPGSQRFTLHVRHRVIQEARGLAGVVERQNVGMIQAGSDLDLAEKALGAQGGRELPA